MGITDIGSLLKSCGRNRSLESLLPELATDTPNPRIAIDLSLITCKYFSVAWNTTMCGMKISAIPYDPREKCIMEVGKLLGNLTNNFMQKGFSVVFCLDGEKSKDKLATENRQKAKETRLPEILQHYCNLRKLMENHANAIFLSTFQFLDSDLAKAGLKANVSSGDSLDEVFGDLISCLKSYFVFPENAMKRVASSLEEYTIRTIRVPEISEGEKLACILTHLGYCHAVYTTDSDALFFGPRCIIKEINQDRCIVYSYSDVLKHLELDNRQFFHLGILLGNDFNVKVRGDGVVEALRKVKDPDFDIKKYDLENCGCLRIAKCIEAFTISQKELELVANAI